MAKTPNGLGQYSGKVGGVVYAVQNGQQIVRSYQPVVSNPKSLAQRKQRAKANLVGRVSQITPWQVLEGLGANRRERRSRFLRLGMRSAVVPESPANPNSITAKLEPAGFRFSEGAIMPTMNVTTAVAEANSVTVTLGKMSGVQDSAWAVSGALLVVVIMSADGVYEHVYYRFVSSSEFSGINLSAQFYHVSEGAYVANIYLAPFEVTDASQLAVITGQLESDANAFAATLSANPSALPLVWGNSNYYRTAEYTPA
jgi:hypothetical protein